MKTKKIWVKKTKNETPNNENREHMQKFIINMELSKIDHKLRNLENKDYNGPILVKNYFNQ